MLVVGIPVLDDNYVWLVHDAESGETAAVDPATDMPVIEAATELGYRISQIWNTHWHPDHCDGNLAIKKVFNSVVYAPAEPRGSIGGVDRIVADGDRLQLGDHEVDILAVPGHTLGHIAFYLPGSATVFTGDTLFAGGCGRVFEGTSAQMWRSLSRLAKLPADTKVYAAHEYTAGNLRFAVSVEPHNHDIAERMRVTLEQRAAGLPTLPTTIAEEQRTNPFIRAGNAAEFAILRAQKDNFR